MEINMANTIPEQNKALVLQAFDTLFNKRDYEAAARFWSDTYIQHSAHIEPGREGLFDLIRSAPDTLRYEPGIVLAEAPKAESKAGGRCSATGSLAEFRTNQSMVAVVACRANLYAPPGGIYL